jgi:alkylation response protein AidB-like acyl-CoA dehydrogenase
MFLEFNDEQLELRESARATLSRQCPPALVRAVADGTGDAASLETEIGWLGWPALTIDVDLGGLGRSFAELAVVLEELGRAAAPGSFLPTTTQFVPIVREVGTPAQAHRFLSGVASGGLTGTVALHESGRYEPEAVTSTAERDGDGWLLRGHKQHVLGAPTVDEVVVAARRDAGTLGLFVVPAAELTFKRTDSIDATRSVANVELNGVWVPDARMLGEPDDDAGRALTRALGEATVGLALDALGVCSALLDTSLAAAVEGRATGQAVEHVLADMLITIEMARAATYRAVAALADGDERAGAAASVAKAAIGGCQRLVTRRSLELAGGPAAAGEADVNLWVGRAKADDLLFGGAIDHRRIVADRLLSARRARSSQLVSALLG